MIRCLLLLSLLIGCPHQPYSDGRGLEGQLEREVVALHQQLRRLEASCGEIGEPDTIFSELHTIFV
ncbi:MAG: hypothetical protein HN348_20140, partial [Proteobacteria bacterium]|nr:hypothetical protein [Pseudomonadota bacterium]